MRSGSVYYIGGFDLPDKNAAALRVLANAKILRELGFDVVLVGVRQGNCGGVVRSQVDYDGFECWSISYPRSKAQWLSYLLGHASLFQFLEKRRIGATAVICYNYPAFAQWRILRWCRRVGARCVADVTEWYDASGGGAIFRLSKTIDVFLRMRLVNYWVDGLITTSAWMTRKYDLQSVPVVELPSLFDVHAVNSPLVTKESGAKRRFVYVGSPFTASRVNSRRSNLKDRLDLVLATFYRLHGDGWDFVFDMYGLTQDEYLEVFPEHAVLLRELGCKATFHGRVPNARAREVVAESDFSIFFRDRTRVTLAGFPTKLAESVTLGTPVISNLYPNVSRYAQTPGLFLAEPGHEMAEVIRALQLSDSELQSIKQNCRSTRTFDYRTYIGPVQKFMAEVSGVVDASD